MYSYENKTRNKNIQDVPGYVDNLPDSFPLKKFFCGDLLFYVYLRIIYLLRY